MLLQKLLELLQHSWVNPASATTWRRSASAWSASLLLDFRSGFVKQVISLVGVEANLLTLNCKTTDKGRTHLNFS
jgi:hypothetical protein